MIAISRTYVRYAMASAIALGSDLGVFGLALSSGFAPAPAAAMGYVVGLVIHWLISTRFVFAEGQVSSGQRRNRQKILFLGTAVAGLALTFAIVGLGALMGAAPLLAKVIAIGVSFQATYMLRKAFVFG